MSTSPAIDRIRRGDWRAPLAAAACALLAAILASQFVASSWLLVPEEQIPVPGRDWLRLIPGLVGVAFWSPVSVGSTDDDEGFGGAASSAMIAPLTVTLAAMLALYVVLRRARRSEGGAWEHALRASVPFALAVSLLSGIFGRLAPDDEIRIRTQFVEPLVGALAVATLVALLAYRDLWRPLPEGAAQLVDRWWGAARVAAYGLGVGIALSCAACVVLLFIHGDQIGWRNVFAGLPSFLGFVINFGIAMFSIAAGGRGVISAGPGEYIALYRLHDLSDWYWLLVLIPIVTVFLTTRYAARRGGVSWLRVAALLVGAWVVLSFASMLRFSLGFGGFGANAGAGASLFWGSLALGAWFGLVAPVVTQYTARGITATEPLAPQPRPRREDDRPPYAAVVLLAVVALLGAAAGVVAGGEREGRIDRELDGP